MGDMNAIVSIKSPRTAWLWIGFPLTSLVLSWFDAGKRLRDCRSPNIIQFERCTFQKFISSSEENMAFFRELEISHAKYSINSGVSG